MDFSSALLWTLLHVLQAQKPRIAESVTVSASVPSLATPAAVTTIGGGELRASPSVALDDTLRSVPGFSLFRRSSSRVANPTTQGVTLRGLAASGSSRALVLADGVPLNDPVGGWVYWNRVPAAALSEVSVSRGAAGDLHGADALAGVVSIRSASDAAIRLLVDAGSHETGRVSAYAGGTHLFGSAELFSTEGFVTVAPESRGDVDTPAGSRHGVGLASAMFSAGDAIVRLRASHARESRRNGTPLQRNSTAGTQIAGEAARPAGSHAGWTARGYVLTQAYEQTFSAVAGDRATERLTNAQDVESVAVGGTASLVRSHAWGASSLTISGRHVDGRLLEGLPDTAPRVVEARQWTGAIAAQASGRRGQASMGGGFRAELWRSIHDGTNEHLFLNPRAWITWRPGSASTALTASIQSGYRGPTINELYRPFRVGNVLTEANAALSPEHALGLEAGVSRTRRAVTWRALGFWSRVDDAIVNVTTGQSNGVILRQRQNASRIHAAGLELEAEVRARPWLAITGAAAYTRSRFVEGALDGADVPQVPRLQHAIGLRAFPGRFRLTAEWRYLGAQFDDDRNEFELASSSMVDARVGWIARRGVELFGAVENALDEEQEVGRTPLRTLGLPRTARVGVRFDW